MTKNFITYHKYNTAELKQMREIMLKWGFTEDQVTDHQANLARATDTEKG